MRSARPTKAVVLAAGFGTRMLPLSRDLPKPLMPLWGVPILDRVLRLLKRWGVKQAVINLHHNPDEIFALGRSLAGPDLQINLSFEPEILGTGGALRRAEWFLNDQPFWLVNSDIVADLKPHALIKAFARRNCIASAWLHPTLGPRTVETSKGWITSFHSARPGAAGTCTFCGVTLVSPRILDFLPESGFAGIIPAYERAMKHGLRVAGVCVPGSTWADVGSPRQYLDAHRLLRKARGTFAAMGPGVVRERNVRIKNSVIWDGAILRAGAVVENAIVGRGADVSGHVGHIAMRAEFALERVERDALMAAGVNPLHATAYPMGPRGSDRTFVRVSEKKQFVILMRYSVKREENALYCEHARCLRRLGLPVPRVLLDRPKDQVAVLEDLGDVSLQEWVAGKTPDAVRGMYERVLDSVLVLHEKGTAAARRWKLMPPFDARLYEWERDLFADQFLKNELRLPSRQIAGVLRDLSRVASGLLAARNALIHRDLQSSNILLRRDRPFFIDFQGMRFGAAAYDLASLLCDPYVSLPETVQEDLLDYYAGSGADPTATTEAFWLAAVERLAQAIGAYVRLGRISGMHSFRRHIEPAIAMMRRALGHVDGLPSLRAAMEEAGVRRSIGVLE